MRIFSSISITYISRALMIPVLFCLSTGCSKMVEVNNPSNELLSTTIYGNDSTAKLAVTGMYNALVNGSTFGNTLYTTSLPALTADELAYYSVTTFDEFYYNNILAVNSLNYTIWQESYKIIYLANAVVEGCTASTGMTDAYKKIATGEAKFIRAYMHFYLASLYGDVPLITTTDVSKTSMMARTPKSVVFDQIIADLKSAQDLLGNDNISASSKVRVNKWIASALLARVYLYTQDFDDAEIQSTAVLNNTSLYKLLASTDIASVFLANSQEAIWQLYSLGNNGYTQIGATFLPGTGTTPKVSITPGLLSAFETGDLRKANWLKTIAVAGTTYYYPYKYKQYTITTATEYSMELRLAEQYLIRAEARAMKNNIAGAQADINAIRNRAGLLNTTAATQSDLLKAIYKERQTELFTEKGHRWFDLKRWGKTDEVLGAVKPSWVPSAALYPIPQTAINSNPNLSQNPNY